MPDAGAILHYLLEQLRRDDSLPANHRDKLLPSRRAKIVADMSALAIVRERQKIKARKQSSVVDGVSRSGKRMGRPPKGRLPSDPNAARLFEAAHEDGEEMDPEGGEASGSPEGSGEAGGNLDAPGSSEGQS
jgi:hypothetical protein